MNCIEYRRTLLAGGAESAPMRAHRLSCDSCSAYGAEHGALEAALKRALDVEAPSALADRLLANIASSARGAQRPEPTRRRFLALAAGVVAVAGVGAHLWANRDDPLALACIQFVMKEEAKSIMMGAIPRTEAARVIASVVSIERLEAIGQIKHIGPCPFNGGTAYHIVLAVPQDKVTLLVMPDAKLPTRGSALYDGLYATVMPIGEGSIGIVGERKAVVASIAGALRRPA